MRRSHNIRRAGLGIVAALCSLAVTVSPAQAVPGLFGSQDPTYDGVVRQSLAITGLSAHRAEVPGAAVRWLQQQQCADGGFMSFRADTTVACTQGDALTWSGEDSNATAAAAIALAAIGDAANARRAVLKLVRLQNADGGFPYYSGASDVNSTAFAVLALRANHIAPEYVRTLGASPIDYLAAAMVRCDAKDPGALAYQVTTPLVANDIATTQALVALSPRLPWSGVRPFGRAVPCGNATTAALRTTVGNYVSTRLAANAFAIPSMWGGGTDAGSTVWAAMGIAGDPQSKRTLTATRNALAKQAATFVAPKGTDDAGRLALALLLTATERPRTPALGGIDLVARLQGTLGA